MKHERECIVCGTRYDFCPNCSEYDDKPRWMFMFHDKNCKDIYEIVNSYRAGAINADKAKTRLSKLDLSDRDTFTGGFKAILDEIWKDGNIEESKRERNEKK